MVEVHAPHVQVEEAALGRRGLPALHAQLQEGGQGLGRHVAQPVREDVRLQGLEEGAGLGREGGRGAGEGRQTCEMRWRMQARTLPPVLRLSDEFPLTCPACKKLPKTRP